MGDLGVSKHNMVAKLLLVEGKRADKPSFAKGLGRKGFEVESFSSGSAALSRLDECTFDLIIIDAASLRSSGRRICQSMRSRATGIPLVLIAEAGQGDALEKDGLVNVALSLPFTLQKLVNRLRPLLPAAEHAELLVAGPIQLDPVNRTVRVGARQTSLTPRLVLLLRLLMERPGEVIERDALFKRVWETTYTEDMRTLDVHISWLRRAVEQDFRNPKYIKTIRGVGYRLDADE